MSTTKTLRLDDKIVEKVEALAIKEKRSFTKMAEVLIEKGLKVKK